MYRFDLVTCALEFFDQIYFPEPLFIDFFPFSHFGIENKCFYVDTKYCLFDLSRTELLNWDYDFFFGKKNSVFDAVTNKNQTFLNIFLAKLLAIITTHRFFFICGNLIKNVRFFEWQAFDQSGCRKKIVLKI